MKLCEYNYEIYVRIPIKLYIEFAKESMLIKTLEGPVLCKKGDAIVHGIAGEVWPVSLDYFRDNYEEVVSKNQKAIGKNGFYIRKIKIVTAYQLQKPILLKLNNKDVLYGNSGDWIVKDFQGSQRIVANHIFVKTYFRFYSRKDSK